MKILVLWGQLAPYMSSFFRSLSEFEDVDVLVIHEAASSYAPFNDGIQAGFDNLCITAQNTDKVREVIRDYGADVILLSGWRNKAYLRLSNNLRKDGVLVVMAMDTPWIGSVRQLAALPFLSAVLRFCVDAAYVPGREQLSYARRLGIVDILEGLYCADASFHVTSTSEQKSINSFVFVGRLVAEKNVVSLAEAYKIYRETVGDPWNLIIAGDGPQKLLLENIPGVFFEGFVQPENLSEVFSRASCLVLPSYYEPWGMVVHEATLSGLLVVASSSVNAAHHLVQNNSNGLICGTSSREIASAMKRISSWSEQRILSARILSKKNAGLFDPKDQAHSFNYFVRDLILSKKV